jgi:hypothetical protein
MRKQGKYAMTDRTEYKDSHERGRWIDSVKIAKTAKKEAFHPYTYPIAS